jgi:NADH-quinone oxidoreductase subunit G
MLALSVRKASLAGAQVFRVGGAREGETHPLPFRYQEVATLDEVPFEGGSKGVVICGAGGKSPELLSYLASSGAKLVMLQPAANGFGAALVALERGAATLAELVESGQVKAVACFEAELPPWLLERVEVLACADWKPGAAAEKASVFLPTTTWVESDGTSINYEGRAQRFLSSRPAGLPLKGLDPKYYSSETEAVSLHPPRVHRKEIPGGAEREAWRVMADLILELGGEPVNEPLTGSWGKLRDLDPEGDGVRIYDLFSAEDLP